jgi:small conductance mechanosensitive channel
MLETIENWIDVRAVLTSIVEFVPNAIAAVLVFAAFVVLFRLTRSPVRLALGKAGLHDALVRLMIDNLYRYALMIVGLVMAADQLGINVAAALAGLGVAGIAVGFAAQDSIANIISGIVIFLDKPFVVGDWIRTEGEFGCVSNITLRTTRIRTPRNTYVVIPNKSIIDAVLENLSKHGEFRVDVPVGIAYKEDVRRAREVLLAAARGVEGVRQEPGAKVVVVELGDSSVNLEVRVWIDEGRRQAPVHCAVLEAAKLALDDAGIQIPFPHLQLFVDDVEERVWSRAAKLAQPR